MSLADVDLKRFNTLLVERDRALKHFGINYLEPDIKLVEYIYGQAFNTLEFKQTWLKVFKDQRENFSAPVITEYIDLVAEPKTLERLDGSNLTWAEKNKLQVRCNKLCALTYLSKFVWMKKPVHLNLLCSPVTLGRCPGAVGATYTDTNSIYIWKSETSLFATYRAEGKQKVSLRLSEDKQKATSLFCPPLSQFKRVTPETLRCGDIEDKLSDIKSGLVKWVKPEVIQFAASGCYCLQYKVRRHCFTNFFGPKEYKEEVELTPTTDIDRCLEACHRMSERAASNYQLDLTPNYDCFWMQTRLVHGHRYIVSLSNIIVHGPSKRVTGSSIMDSITCSYVDLGHCNGPSQTKVVFHKKFQEILPKLQEIDLAAEVKYTGSDPTAITVPGLGSVFINSNCHVLYMGEWYYQGGDGTLWGTGTAMPVNNKIECNITQVTRVHPNFFQPIFQTAWELRRELLNCYTRKQVLLNGLKTGTPIDPYILQGLTYGDAKTYALYPHPTGLYGADCSSVDYDTLEWVNHDIWLVKHKGNTIGCMDARLNMILRDCIIYNETRVREIDHQWIVEKKEDGQYKALRKVGEGVLINMLYDVSSSISAYLDSLITPPAYPPSTGGPSGHPPDFDPNRPNSNTTSTPFDWFYNLSIFGKIGAVTGIILGVGLGCIILWLIIKGIKLCKENRH